MNIKVKSNVGGWLTPGSEYCQFVMRWRGKLTRTERTVLDLLLAGF